MNKFLSVIFCVFAFVEIAHIFALLKNEERGMQKRNKGIQE